ncbi:GFA family protein [Maricaulis sp.]|uniref:GFA family protein n=1 Tax=Maricaulis sp. TaxID=1486257 RepID=UPI003A907CDC
MTTPNLPLQGTCRCGDVAVELTAPPLMTAACHCTGCQKMSASAFSLTAMVPPYGFAVTRGETRRGGLGEGQLDHQFCPRCMTWVFTRIAGLDYFVSVRPTMFEDTSWFSPFIETMTQDRLAWATTPARHSFEAFPAMEDIPALMAEFAESA